MDRGFKSCKEDLKSLEWGIVMGRVVDSLLDDFSEVVGVGAHEVNLRRRNPKRR